MASVGIIMCFLAGVQWRYFIGAGVSIVGATPVIWHFMHDYQKRRVLTFLNPDQDPLGAGYNILQSMIAIGSGGLFGKGYLKGSQSQLNFLPEKHTDFIFTMLAEEFGFLGSLILLGLYIILLWLGMMVALRSRSTFGAMVASGVCALIFMHVLINCSMVMGMMPVVGVPLPLMSYGGSIMVSTVLAAGLLLNAYVNRDQLPLRMTPKL
jgi:rod shape determining protein RodA